MMPRKPALTPNSKGRVRFVAVSRSISPFGLIGLDSSLKGGGASLVCPTAARARLRRRSSPPMSGEDDVADEGDWYAALVAGEHVGDWLDTVRDPARSAGRRERAARSLAAKVSSDGTYADEAREANAAATLESALADLPPGATRDAVEAALAACRSAAGAETVREFAFDGARVLVRETSHGNGVGARLWKAAVMLAHDLARHPEWCADARVLELGAGVGLCGLLAAKLGARTVVLTDFEHPLLDSLVVAARDDNALDVRPGPDAPVRVARCDWREELADALGADAPSADQGADDDEVAPGGWSLRLRRGETYNFIFGSDVLYEEVHAATIPTVVKRRLAPGGRCRLVGAVRDRAMLDRLVAEAARVGLETREEKMSDNVGDDWYEDGYVALEVTHAPRDEGGEEKTTRGGARVATR